jgi:hypothetical protein
MLTAKGLNERNWDVLPALRKVLNGKPIWGRPHRWIEDLYPVFDIAASVKDHKADLFTAVRGDPQFAEALVHDLQILMKELRVVREHVSNEIQDLDKVCEEVHHSVSL